MNIDALTTFVGVFSTKNLCQWLLSTSYYQGFIILASWIVGKFNLQKNTPQMPANTAGNVKSKHWEFGSEKFDDRFLCYDLAGWRLNKRRSEKYIFWVLWVYAINKYKYISIQLLYYINLHNLRVYQLHQPPRQWNKVHFLFVSYRGWPFPCHVRRWVTNLTH